MGSHIQQITGAIRHRPLRGFAGTVLLVGLLAGCDEQGQFAFPGNGQGAARSAVATGPTVERDVEAPEVFSVTDDGLWDGRPSLGGVWVAHPDVTDPERVIIRNQSNGQFVVGALFRRERNIPGPSLQISSDAAEALGTLAGAPTKLNVTALKKIQEPSSALADADPAPSETIDDAPAIATSTLDPVATTALDPVATTASAAIDAAAPTPPPAPNPGPPPQATRLDKPFIQIGIFSMEANAERAAKQMRGAGLLPTIKQSQISGKTFWRVLVGPAATSSERAKILSTIKSEGFTDAYAVSS